MKLVFITNLPSPYRVDFFNELGKYCELTVLYERVSSSERDENWKNKSERSFEEIFCNLKPLGVDKSIGLDVIRQLMKLSFDKLIITGISSPSIIMTIIYCQLKRIPYFLEDDGDINRHQKERHILLKRILLSKCRGYFTTTDYNVSLVNKLGVNKAKIYKYSFSSVWEREIISCEEKLLIQRKRMKNKRYICSVGRLVPSKGFDILISGMKLLGDEYELYIIGGDPSKDYLNLIEETQANNVHFIGFCDKEKLFNLYRLFDLFVLPTRSDVWGLVVNEAMANGLPVITTDMCGAGLEMVEDDINGFIFPVDDIEAMVKAIHRCFESTDKLIELSINAIGKAKKYTIEVMTQEHLHILS